MPAADISCSHVWDCARGADVDQEVDAEAQQGHEDRESMESGHGTSPVVWGL